MTLAAFLADTLARWGAMMQRPLHPTAVPRFPSPDDIRAQVDAMVRAEEAKRTAVEPALLPSTDYRTNPRPVQTPVYPRPLAIAAITFQQPGWERVDGDRLTVVDAR